MKKINNIKFIQEDIKQKIHLEINKDPTNYTCLSILFTPIRVTVESEIFNLYLDTSSLTIDAILT